MASLSKHLADSGACGMDVAGTKGADTLRPMRDSRRRPYRHSRLRTWSWLFSADSHLWFYLLISME